MEYITRYYLGIAELGEFEVDKKKFVAAERSAGFRNRWGPDSEPATDGFSCGPFTGTIRHEKVPATVPTEPAIDRVHELASRLRLNSSGELEPF